MATARKHCTLSPGHSYIPSFILSSSPDKTAGFSQHSITMRLTGSRAYTRPTPTPKMPAGLVELMEGLTKDVLKNNPDDIYEFCAGHMQKLIDIRDGNLPKKQKMSLEDKIKRAQEKVRQKIQERLLQYDDNDKPKPDNVTAHGTNTIVETGQKNIVAPATDPDTIISTEDTNMSKQPIPGEEISNVHEVDTLYEPNVTVATADGNTETLIKPHESTNVNKENESVTVSIENEVAKESQKTCDGNEHLPFKSDALHTEESTKLETDVNDGYSETKDLPFTPETLGHEHLMGVNESEKVTEMDVKPISSELPIEIAANETKETTTVQSKAEPEIDHVASDYSNDDKVTQNTDNVISAPPIQHDASNLKGSLENHKEPDVDTVKECQGTEEIPPTETQRVEIVENPTEQNIELQTVYEALKSESISTPKTNQIDEDIHRKDDHDTDEEKKVEDVKLAELTTNVESEIKSSRGSKDYNTIKDDPKEKKEDKEKNESREGMRLENKSVEIDSSSNIDHSEMSTKKDTPCQDVIKENVGMNTKENEKVTVPESVQNVELLKSAPSSESDENKNELSVIEGNVIEFDTAREFLEQERQFSTESVKEKVSEKSILENNNIEQSDATTETNPSGTGMDLETAAVTIQKVFRTFLFSKSRTSTLNDGVNENALYDDIDKKFDTEFLSSGNINKERRALGISRMDTVLQTVNEEKSLSLSTDDSSTLSSAATTIQAHVRGFLARARFASRAASKNSDGPSTASLDGESSEPKKTILNIHILPERGQFMSRDESILTSLDLPLDNSPPSSVNLHPLGYDKSEPRKQLKREDAIQSVSPPSNNSGKISEEVDSMKENENNIDSKPESENTTISSHTTDQRQEDAESCDTTLTISSTADTVVDAEVYNIRELSSPEHISDVDNKNKEAAATLSSDEMDVVTPFPNAEKTTSSPDTESNEKPKLIHSGEFHDMVVQTQVKRSEPSVVREFKNVLVYFLLWDKT